MAHTNEVVSLNAQLKSAVSASIPGGMNAAIAAGSAQTNPVCNFYDGAVLLLSVLLDPVHPISDPANGVASLQRPGPVAWTNYSQNAAASGTCDNFKVLNRDEATVFSGSCGATGSGADYVFANGVTWTAGAPIITNGYQLTEQATAT